MYKTMKDASETMIQNNNGEDLMSTSDTSSHLWQGISGNDTYSFVFTMHDYALTLKEILQYPKSNYFNTF